MRVWMGYPTFCGVRKKANPSASLSITGSEGSGDDWVSLKYRGPSTALRFAQDDGGLGDVGVVEESGRLLPNDTPPSTMKLSKDGPPGFVAAMKKWATLFLLV